MKNRASFIDDSFQVVRRVSMTQGTLGRGVPTVDLLVRGKVVTVPENAVVYLEFEEGDPNEPT